MFGRSLHSYNSDSVLCFHFNFNSYVITSVPDIYILFVSNVPLSTRHCDKQTTSILSIKYSPLYSNMPTAPQYRVYHTELILSNILTLSVPEEGYSRNVSRALNLIFTCLLLSYTTQELAVRIQICLPASFVVYQVPK